MPGAARVQCLGLPAIVASCLAFTAACTSMRTPTPEETPNTRIALEFAHAMAAGETARAHGLLSPALQAELTQEKLASDYQEMVSYGSGAPSIVQVMTTMSEWPDKRASDTEWVYVAIANDTYSEAVTVVVAQESSRLAIRSLEWGRP